MKKLGLCHISFEWVSYTRDGWMRSWSLQDGRIRFQRT